MITSTYPLIPPYFYKHNPVNPISSNVRKGLPGVGRVDQPCEAPGHPVPDGLPQKKGADQPQLVGYDADSSEQPRFQGATDVQRHHLTDEVRPFCSEFEREHAAKGRWVRCTTREKNVRG